MMATSKQQPVHNISPVSAPTTSPVCTVSNDAEPHHLTPIELAPLSDRPLVSILTSNYNYAAFLPDAAESLLAQTYSEFEWIICDDGSTDHSLEVLQELAKCDSRIRVIAKANGGQASGFNRAFESSSGELLFFLDSDDAFYPTKLETMVRAHQSEPQAGLGLHRVQWVNQVRKRQGVWPSAANMPSGWHGELMLSSGGVLPYMPPTSGLSLHRTVADRIFPLPETPKLPYADQIVTRLAPFLTNVVRRQDILAEYRVHGNNAFIRKGTSADSILWEIILCGNLWAAQREFLRALKPGAEERLQTVDASPYLIYLRYLYARLAGADDQRFRYKEYIGQMNNGSLIMNTFWKASLYLPAPLFADVVSFLSRPGTLKQVAAWLRERQD
jgi:glycosyltransferase involved in cell wall biosynthesis